MGSFINNSQLDCDVVIIGGGIAGLTLANCLEQAGISYTVWEAGSEAAPANGAGVGILPHGARILDQLGLMTAIENITVPIKYLMHHDENGKMIANDVGIGAYTDEFGYDGLSVERRRLVQLMYENLRNKTPVHYSRKVIAVEQWDHCVVVTASDGSCVKANVVVGADGVHSCVRKAIQDFVGSPSADMQPDYLSARFACVYGMSDPFEKLTEGEGHIVYRKNLATLMFVGKGAIIYWFAFKDLGRDHPYDERLHFSDDDLEQACQSMADFNVTEDVKFGEIYARKTIATMVPLEEGVAPIWNSQRAILIGDSAHKMAPQGAMGGNMAIEDAASLANHLVEARKKSPSGQLSQDSISTALSAYTQTRKARALGTVALAGSICRRQFLLSPQDPGILEAMGKMTCEQWLDKASLVFCQAGKVDYLPAESARAQRYAAAIARWRAKMEAAKGQEVMKPAVAPTARGIGVVG